MTRETKIKRQLMISRKEDSSLHLCLPCAMDQLITRATGIVKGLLKSANTDLTTNQRKDRSLKTETVGLTTSGAVKVKVIKLSITTLMVTLIALSISKTVPKVANPTKSITSVATIVRRRSKRISKKANKSNRSQ